MKMEDHFALPLIMLPPNPSATAKIAAAHAINCHDELVEALELFKCECTGRCAIHEWMSADDAICARKHARAILTKAKGE